MSEVLLTLHCAVQDNDAVVEALRGACQAPLHVRAEAVRGRDFGDAATGEKVTGELRRTALEVMVAHEAVAGLLRCVEASRHQLPIRWRITPIIDHGRIA